MLEDDLTKLRVVQFSSEGVEMITENVSKSYHIGLTPFFNPEREPSIVCLTTRDTIHVLRMSQNEHIDFLNQQLMRVDIQLYIADGLHASGWLKDSLELDLAANVLDLSALHVAMTIRSEVVRKINHGHKFTAGYILKEMKLKRLNYKQLIRLYSRVDMDFSTTLDDAHLEDSRLTHEAIEIIRHNAGSVRDLAVRMMERFRRIRDQPSRHIFKLATTSDATRELYDRKRDNDYSTLLAMFEIDKISENK